MKTSLTSEEHLEFKRIANILKLREDTSSLILLGVNTKKLANEFTKYFSKEYNLEKYEILSNNILLNLAQKNDSQLKVINLYGNENIIKISENLQFSRDFIPEFKMKLILIFDKENYENLIEKCFDFYSTNSFAYNFIDHSYVFDSSKKQENKKLNKLILDYENYISSHNKPSNKIKTTMLFNIANEAYNVSELEISLEYYEKSLLLAKLENLKQEKSTILGNIGLIYQDKGDLDIALKYFKEALDIDKEIEYSQGIANSLGNIGFTYQVKGDFDASLKYSKEALDIHKKIGYTEGIKITQNNINSCSN